MFDKLADVIESFYLDIVGSIVAGILLLGGWVWLTGGASPLAKPLPHITALPWWAIVALALVAGHIIASLGEWLVLPVVRALCEWDIRVSAPRKPLFAPRQYADARINFADRKSAKYLRGKVEHLNGIDLNTPTGGAQLRSAAMTLLPAADIATARRFAAIALLCHQVATTSLILAVAFAVQQWLAADGGDLRRAAYVGAIALGIAIPMLRRWAEFDSRAFYTPVDMAAARIEAESASAHPRGTSP